ncbi:MAG: methyltransferase [Anaerolineae bacterium]|nr:methyltransferase [Anaerolineae bacterium]
MTPRERVLKAINHQVPDKVPLDLGSTAVTGIAASALYRLRKILGLEERPVLVHEPYQMLGFVENDVVEALGIDVLGLIDDSTMFGFPLKDWKPFTLFDGTPVLVPGGFNTEISEDGYLYQYPGGDRSVPPSGRMPKDGFYHDAIERQEPYDPDSLDPEEWVRDMYHVLTEEELRLLEERATKLYNETDRAIIGNFGGAGFGDIALVPGLAIPYPKGIRAVEDWYMATILYPQYVKGIFDLQLEIVMQNLELYRQAVGDKIVAIFISGTDFGAQTGPFISPDAYREMFKPYHKTINEWVHKNTNWKTFYHSCGSMVALYDEFVDAGVDIVNPVQISAAGMDPRTLKERWGEKLVFWGGGIDTQHVLSFGTPEEIEAQVKENIEIFGKGGGYVFNTVHNIQATVPTENLKALFDAFRKYRDYS